MPSPKMSQSTQAQKSDMDSASIRSSSSYASNTLLIKDSSKTGLSSMGQQQDQGYNEKKGLEKKNLSPSSKTGEFLRYPSTTKAMKLANQKVSIANLT
jgi:hypothetical protein